MYRKTWFIGLQCQCLHLVIIINKQFFTGQMENLLSIQYATIKGCHVSSLNFQHL